LNRPIYVRPVMRPSYSFLGAVEKMPEDILPLDLIHRSVRRMFEGEGTQPPTCPTARVINFSLGDPTRQFLRHVSAWGRLFDWLSWKYGVLIVVSAGNHTDPMEL